MNSAKYISKKFQKALEENHGWRQEARIINQRIDAFTHVRDSGITFFVHEPDFRELIYDYWSSNEGSVDPLQLVRNVYHQYFKRDIYDIDTWGSEYKQYFTSAKKEEIEFRVGLEFETGNIASSFRAFNKLNTLYREGEIDVGVFVATTRKSAQTIWPPENRNGSFEELENRNYRNNVHFPIIEFVFEPDSFDPSVPYLGSKGSTYRPNPLDEHVEHNGEMYQLFQGDGKVVARPST